MFTTKHPKPLDQCLKLYLPLSSSAIALWGLEDMHQWHHYATFHTRFRGTFASRAAITPPRLQLCIAYMLLMGYHAAPKAAHRVFDADLHVLLLSCLLEINTRLHHGWWKRIYRFSCTLCTACYLDHAPAWNFCRVPRCYNRPGLEAPQAICRFAG